MIHVQVDIGPRLCRIKKASENILFFHALSLRNHEDMVAERGVISPAQTHSGKKVTLYQHQSTVDIFISGGEEVEILTSPHLRQKTER